MEIYIVIGLLVVVIILLIVLLVKKNNNEEITLKLGKFETDITKALGDFKYDFSKDIEKDFKETNEVIEKRLMYLNEKVNERLDANFEKTNKTFTSILERISKIDEAQKKIDGLSNDIISLQSVLTDKKTRGIFGETNLQYILNSVFGVNDKIYRLQYTMSNETIADAVVFAPEPLGTIAIDSKFPLEHYQIMTDRSREKSERDAASKAFKADVKKHIDAIIGPMHFA